jgi:recombination protein RecA
MPRTASIQAAIAAAQKKYGIKIGSLKDVAVDIDVYSTGNLALDYATAVGGIPVGRLVELYGPPSSGKTTTAILAAADCQRKGGTVLFVDHEQAIDKEYCAALGLDTEADTFIYFAPDFLEQGVNVARALMRTGDVDIVIFDSVAAMVPEKELESETGKSSFASQAKLMSQTCKQLVSLATTHRCTVIFLNHLQEVIDSSPMGQKLAASGVQRKTTPGGKALKFYASMRIEFKPIGGIREKVWNPIKGEHEDQVTQQKVEVMVVKNKVGVPHRKAELRTIFGKGFSTAHSALQIITANKLGINKEASGVFRFKDQELAPKSMDVETKQNFIRGESEMLQKLEASPEWTGRLERKAREFLDDMLKQDKVLSEDDISADPDALPDPDDIGAAGSSSEPEEGTGTSQEELDKLLQTAGG